MTVQHRRSLAIPENESVSNHCVQVSRRRSMLGSDDNVRRARVKPATKGMLTEGVAGENCRGKATATRERAMAYGMMFMMPNFAT